MKNIVKLMLFLFVPMKLFGFGTTQISDLIIYKGDTLSLFAYPIKFYPNEKLINPKSLFGNNECSHPIAWRDYVVTWEIIDNQLYLVNIRNACYPTPMKNAGTSFKGEIQKDYIGSEFADLKALFPNKYKNGKVKADWVTGKLISPQGKLLYYFPDGYYIYKTELEFTIENGILIDTKQLDNSKTKKSKYLENPNLLVDFIYNNIHYENLPKSDTIKRRVIVTIISSDDNGKIDNVRVLRGVNKLYDNEAIRVIKSIPEWEVIYIHGEKISRPYSIPVNFDLTEKKENSEKIPMK